MMTPRTTTLLFALAIVGAQGAKAQVGSALSPLVQAQGSAVDPPKHPARISTVSGATQAASSPKGKPLNVPTTPGQLVGPSYSNSNSGAAGVFDGATGTMPGSNGKSGSATRPPPPPGLPGPVMTLPQMDQAIKQLQSDLAAVRAELQQLKTQGPAPALAPN